MRGRGKRVMAVGGLVGAFLLGGATYGAVQLAGASGSGTTYYGCLSAKGGLSKVGTVSPTCAKASTVISWDSQGPQGVPGVPGPAGGIGAGCLFMPASGPADWHNCYLGNVNLSGANLTSVNLDAANLRGTTLLTTNLSNADLAGAEMVLSNLTLANLGGADLKGTSLLSANLTDADLTGANLTGANLTYANLFQVVWNNTTCPDGTNSATYSPQTCVGHGA